MAHNRTTQYSAPFKRNTLLGLHQYAASEHFPSLGKWDRARTEDLYVVRGTSGRTQPVQIILVGAISSDKMFLKPHGNYDPTYMPFDQIGKKAKLQFVMTSPDDDPDFSADYTLALQRLRAIQDEVAGSACRREHFIEGNNLRMNFYLFQEKEGDFTSDHEIDRSSDEDGSENASEDRNPTPIPRRSEYEVSPTYASVWESVGETYDNCIMEVYGTDEKPINYRYFDRHLRSGATVMVTFSLKHFAIRDKGSSQVVSDTYSAIVQSVSILKEAEKLKRRSANPGPNRRPLPVSQNPPRATLQFAADAFAPVRRREVGFATPIVDENVRPASGVAPVPHANPEQMSDNLHSHVGVLMPSSRSNVSPSHSTMSQPLPDLMDQLVPFILERIKRSASAVSQRRAARRDGSALTSLTPIAENASAEGGASSVPASDAPDTPLPSASAPDDSSCNGTGATPTESLGEDPYSSDLTDDSMPELEPVSDDDFYLDPQPSTSVDANTSGVPTGDDSSWVEVPSVTVPGINPDCEPQTKEGSVKRASPDTQTDVSKRESDQDKEVEIKSSEKKTVKTPAKKSRYSKKRKA